jgi:acetyl esterase/lipase
MPRILRPRPAGPILLAGALLLLPTGPARRGRSCWPVYGPAFGDDPKVRADASPLTHVRPGLPPFLVLTAEDDLPTLAGMATRFHDALRQCGCDARLIKVCKRNHKTILFCATGPDDPVAREALEFIHRHAR